MLFSLPEQLFVFKFRSSHALKFRSGLQKEKEGRWRGRYQQENRSFKKTLVAKGNPVLECSPWQIVQTDLLIHALFTARTLTLWAGAHA
jgi:hypothetical protein